MSTWVYSVRGVDVSASVVPGSVRISNTGYRGLANATLRIQDKAGTIVCEPEDVVLITENGTRRFGGLVRDRGRSIIGPNKARAYDLTCQDFTSLLSDDVITSGGNRGVSESDKARITWLINTFGTKGITAGAEVQDTGTTMDKTNYNGTTLDEAVASVTKESGATYYADQNKKLHNFLTETDDAPWNFSDAPNGTTTRSYFDLKMPDDSAGLVNAIWVIGDGIRGWRTDATSISTYGRREGVLRLPKVKTQAALNRRGDAYLKRHAYPIQSGTFSTYNGVGLRAGQRFQLTNNLWSISAVTYRIQEVNVSIESPQGRARYDVAFGSGRPSLGHALGQDDQNDADTRDDIIESVQRMTDLSLAGANLVPNSSAESAGDWVMGGFSIVAAAGFHGSKVFRASPSAASISQFRSSAFIPVVRTADYWISVYSLMSAYTSGTGQLKVLEYDSGGSLLVTTIFDTVAAVEADWTRHTVHFGPAADEGVTAFNASTTQIKVAADSASTMTCVWAIDAWQVERTAQITSYAPMPSELVDSSVTAAKVAAGAISTAAFAAGIRPVDIVAALPTLPDAAYPEGAVAYLTTNDKLYRSTGAAWTVAVDGADITAASIIAGKIAAGAIGATEIASHAITAAQIAALTITAAEIAALAIDATKIAANAIVAGKIAAGTITAADIAAATITAAQLAALNIDTRAVTITNGKLTLASDSGADVIIDGTSQMFRIAATGQITLTAKKGKLVSKYRDLALPLISYNPLTIWSFKPVAYNTGNYKVQLPFEDVGHAGQVLNQYRGMSAYLGSNVVRVIATLFSPAGTGGTVTYRYYVMELAAI